jgi:hypothetical protein
LVKRRSWLVMRPRKYDFLANKSFDFLVGSECSLLRYSIWSSAVLGL